MGASSSKRDIMKIEAINYYKGIAILMVVMIHTSQRFYLEQPLLNITKFGDLGCQIFFTLSAFCLCLSQEKKKLSYIDFLKNRLKRIAVGYWLTVILGIGLARLCVFFTGKNHLLISMNPFDVIANLLFVNGLCPASANNLVVRGGWFIGTLVIFYSIFPLLFRCITRTSIRPFVVLIICTLMPLFNYIIWVIIEEFNILSLHFNDSYIYYFSFINQMPSFALGIYMYLLYSINKNNDKMHPIYYIWFSIFMVLLILFKYSGYELKGIFTPYLVSISFIYLFEITRRNINNKRIYTKFISAIGKKSFNIYLLNTFIAWELGTLVSKVLSSFNQSIVYLFWFPVAVILLYLLSLYYEKVIFFFNKLIFKEYCQEKKN